jgi:branched-subunit amino acid transport protein
LVGRIVYAGVRAALSLIIWYYLPITLMERLGLPVGERALLFLGPAAVIAALNAVKIVWAGTGLGAAAHAGASLAAAFWLYTVAEGGVITISTGELAGQLNLPPDVVVAMTLDFRPLLYLFMLPLLLGVVRAAWGFLHREVSRPLREEEHPLG